MSPARVITADCPWLFADKLPGEGRGAQRHYQGMNVSDLARFPLPPLADDAWLFLWRVGTHQEEAAFVMKAWGFTYCAELVWIKKTTNGKKHFGMGRTFRAAHEVCLVGKRGRPKPNHLSQRSVFEAAVGKHSEKPRAFFDIVEKFSAGPYVELFSRMPRDGWLCYGNQLRQTEG